MSPTRVKTSATEDKGITASGAGLGAEKMSSLTRGMIEADELGGAPTECRILRGAEATELVRGRDLSAPVP